MRVRQAVAADAEAIATIHIRGWQTAYRGQVPQDFLDAMEPAGRRAYWEQQLAAPSWPTTGTLVAETDGRVAGFAALCPARDPDADPVTVGELAAIYVAPDRWRAGIGGRLMTATLETLTRARYRQATLWVLGTNAPARRFYEATGWHADGTVKQESIGGVPLTEVRYRRPLGWLAAVSRPG